MKYLINADFRVVMKGKAVTESQLLNDFIYDTEDKTGLTVAQMKDIAKANGNKLKGKSTKDVKSSFDECLDKLKLPEKRKMSETEQVLKIVKDGHAAELSEDEILIQIVTAGIKFQSAIKMMKNALIELGFSVTSKERYEKAKAILEDDAFEPEEYSEVKEMAEKISKEIGGTSEAQAIAQIRKYCKEAEVDLPKKTKDKKVSLAIRVMAWMVLNWESDVSDLEEWLEEIEAPEKATKVWGPKFEAVKKEMAAQEKANAVDEED